MQFEKIALFVLSRLQNRRERKETEELTKHPCHKSNNKRKKKGMKASNTNLLIVQKQMHFSIPRSFNSTLRRI
jgi:hypothetical protein